MGPKWITLKTMTTGYNFAELTNGLMQPSALLTIPLFFVGYEAQIWLCGIPATVHDAKYDAWETTCHILLLASDHQSFNLLALTNFFKLVNFLQQSLKVKGFFFKRLIKLVNE